eukprot:gnl/TRDRNA2_/TRDRNA2_134610_c0_seq1.p1 gnl/TRDRNA2_/TRDRNA2_134610_c0~~gnl/TRDRNA2_/TRDRNA2_134610_c0_seq1.p1  ORF type:complete len:371 (+),score=61.94 gnl/TRDRNA2_/TRDRNA2_134610_c0_seq1:51-1115(+)
MPEEEDARPVYVVPDGPPFCFRVTGINGAFLMQVPRDETVKAFHERVVEKLKLGVPLERVHLTYRDQHSGGAQELHRADPMAPICALVPDRSALRAMVPEESAEVKALRAEGAMLKWEGARLGRELRGLHVLVSSMKGRTSGKDRTNSPPPSESISPAGDSAVADAKQLRAENMRLREEQQRLVRELRGLESLAHRLSGGAASATGIQRAWRGPVVGGVIRPSPTDGNCLFHSLAAGIGLESAATLRKEICDFIKHNPTTMMAKKSIQEWVMWESGQPCTEYADSMSIDGTWAGPIEMAVCSHMMNINIRVYQTVAGGGFQLLCGFDAEAGVACKTVNLAYQPGHYDLFDMQAS